MKDAAEYTFFLGFACGTAFMTVAGLVIAMILRRRDASTAGALERSVSNPTPQPPRKA